MCVIFVGSRLLVLFILFVSFVFVSLFMWRWSEGFCHLVQFCDGRMLVLCVGQWLIISLLSCMCQMFRRRPAGHPGPRDQPLTRVWFCDVCR